MRQVGDRDDTALGDGDGQDVHATLGDGDGQDAAKEPLDAQALVDLAGGGPSAMWRVFAWGVDAYLLYVSFEVILTVALTLTQP